MRSTTAGILKNSSYKKVVRNHKELLDDFILFDMCKYGAIEDWECAMYQRVRGVGVPRTMKQDWIIRKVNFKITDFIKDQKCLRSKRYKLGGKQ